MGGGWGFDRPGDQVATGLSSPVVVAAELAAVPRSNVLVIATIPGAKGATSGLPGSVLTGGVSGIGREFLLQLVRRGSHVAVCDIERGPLERAVQQARPSNPDVRVTAYVHDVATGSTHNLGCVAMQAWRNEDMSLCPHAHMLAAPRDYAIGLLPYFTNRSLSASCSAAWTLRSSSKQISLSCLETSGSK